MAYHLRDRIAAAVVLLLATAGLIHIQDMPSGAAMFPRLILGLAVFLSVCWLISTILPRRRPAGGPRDEATPHPFMENPGNLATFLMVIAAYIALIDVIGYFTSTIVFIPAAAFALGFRRVTYTAITVLLFVGFVYFIFVVLFNRPLPIEFFQQ